MIVVPGTLAEWRLAGRAAAPPASPPAGVSRRPPVMLATLGGAPVEPEAVELAIAVAREHGARLVVVDVAAERARGRRTALQGAIVPAPAVRAVAESAAAQGIAVTVLHGPSPRPVATLARAVAGEQPRLLVFAADPARLSAWRALSVRRYERVVGLLERRTACLMWAPAARRAAAPAARPR